MPQNGLGQDGVDTGYTNRIRRGSFDPSMAWRNAGGFPTVMVGFVQQRRPQCRPCYQTIRKMDKFSILKTRYSKLGTKAPISTSISKRRASCGLVITKVGNQSSDSRLSPVFVVATGDEAGGRVFQLGELSLLMLRDWSRSGS